MCWRMGTVRLPRASPVILRPATLEDAATISVIHRLAAFLPPLHTAEENLWFVRDRLMSENQTWVAEAGGEVVGYIAFNDGWVRPFSVSAPTSSSDMVSSTATATR